MNGEMSNRKIASFQPPYMSASTTIELSHGSSLPERKPIQSRPFPAASADSASAPSSASPAAAGERFPR
jgi:hypothetical protein